MDKEQNYYQHHLQMKVGAVLDREVCGTMYAYLTENEIALLKEETDTEKEFTIKIRASYSYECST